MEQWKRRWSGRRYRCKRKMQKDEIWKKGKEILNERENRCARGIIRVYKEEEEREIRWSRERTKLHLREKR